MPATLYNLDLANLFPSDEVGASNSQHLVMEGVTIPGMEETTKEHNPGGGVGSIMLGQRSFKLGPLSFDLKGVNPEVMNKIMPAGASVTPWTVRANIRDVRAHKDIPLKAIVRGRLTKVELGNFRREDGLSNKYEIAEIHAYQLFFNNQEKVFYDWFQGPRGLRIDGVYVLDQAAINIGL